VSDPKPPVSPRASPKSGSGEREAKLAKALRDNLRRRKAAAQPKPASGGED
jgi:hypothetical protein